MATEGLSGPQPLPSSRNMSLSLCLWAPGQPPIPARKGAHSKSEPFWLLNKTGRAAPIHDHHKPWRRLPTTTVGQGGSRQASSRSKANQGGTQLRPPPPFSDSAHLQDVGSVHKQGWLVSVPELKQYVVLVR